MEFRHVNLPVLNILVSIAGSHAIDPSLVGTWTSKSGKVLTGSGFYDPVNEIIIEPNLTGISYSFSADGYYEEALYRAISNATTPSCPSAVVQWQHGRAIQLDNGSLSLSPFAVDGRQILSQPCLGSTTSLTRWNQSELFSKFEVLRDSYNGRMRLNLWQWDGTPVNPMWLAYTPPDMLSTSTLNPTSTSSAATATTRATLKSRRGDAGATSYERSGEVPTYWSVRSTTISTLQQFQVAVRGSRIFWIGVCMMSLGGVLVVAF